MCRCGCLYVGRTSLRLQERITQRIPKSIRNKETPTKVLPRRNCKAKTSLNQLECDSAIGLHLLQNPDCAAHYLDRQFSILAKARTQFHLAALEAIFIITQQPICAGRKNSSTLFKFYNNQLLGGVHTKFDNHPIKTSRKTIKGRIFRLQFILALILATSETKTVRIFFNSLFQGYQSFQKIDDESDSDQSNLKLLFCD